MKLSSIFKGVIVFGVVAVLLIGIMAFGSLMEYVDNDEYAIHQSIKSGKLSVWNTPGWHIQMFGKVVKYKKAVDIYLSGDPLDGGTGKSAQAISVLFPDGQADVDVVGRYKLSLNEEIQKNLYINYGDAESVKSMVRQQVLEGVKQVGPIMSSAEAYSDRKPEFAILAKRQSLEGIFQSEILIDTTTDKDGNLVFVKRYNVKYLDVERTNPSITKKSILAEYKITLPQFNVKDMKFDDKTVALINARKEAQKARQDAITAYQEGQARVAKERAAQEVVKIKAVTIAEKDKDVAVLEAKKKKEVAEYAALESAEKKKAKILIAQAKKAELDIADGLSDRVKYQIDAMKEATIESAKHLATFKGPEIVFTGGSGSSGGSSGLETVLMVEMVRKLTNEHVKSSMSTAK